MQFVPALEKFRVTFERYGFNTEKNLYAPGEPVEVSYMAASDMSYRFFIDGVEFEQGYDPARGILLRFVMPAHDVTIRVESWNSMTFDPNASANIRSREAKDRWFCPECGTENFRKFCTECGRKKLE